jgi:hypothetical protein
LSQSWAIPPIDHKHLPELMLVLQARHKKKKTHQNYCNNSAYLASLLVVEGISRESENPQLFYNANKAHYAVDYGVEPAFMPKLGQSIPFG